MKQIWRTIPDFPDYMISIYGEVKSYKKEKPIILKPGSTGHYLYICFVKNKKHYNRYIHRLVAEAFVPNPKNKPQVNHKDGDKKNNYYKNLEWVTAKENTKHAWKNGLLTLGEGTSQSKLTTKQVIEIKKRLRKEKIIKIAKDLKIPYITIYQIKNKRNWSFVNPDRHKKRTIFYKV